MTVTKGRTLLALLAGFGVAGCGSSDSTSVDAGLASDGGVARTLANCATNIDSAAPQFFRDYFRCVTITTNGTSVTIATQSLPPHQSNYYGAASANYAPFDTSRGPDYHANRNFLTAQDIQITIPTAPVARGLSITSTMIDGVGGTHPNEYPLGPAGVALDSVALFNPLAAPGMDIEDEKFTFDSYSAHPTPNSQYHYHTTSPGPLEVLVSVGVGTTTVPGSAAVELYGMMCDGTVVMGCTELDGSAPSASDFDAQSGHVHDLRNGQGNVLLTGRYHVHVCPTATGGRKFTPEIQYYTTCTRGAP